MNKKIRLTTNRKRIFHFFKLTRFIFFFSYSGFLLGMPGVPGRQDSAPPNIGNFALRVSQQPGPLISFGQNIIDKGQTQISFFMDAYQGYHTRSVDLSPAILYALSDRLSAFLSIPIAARNQYEQNISSGLEDASLQLEYAIFSKQNTYFTEQITLITGLGFPTGSIRKNPATGVGALSTFLGGTYNRTYVDWFFFTSPGVNLNSSHQGIRFGNATFYQYGLGRHLFTTKSNLLIAGMVEMNGQYWDKNKAFGIKNPNSGGHVIYILPSIWLSTSKLIVQFGAGGVAYQYLFGNQNKNKYLLVANLEWTL